jgi:hypothetical protein
VTEDLDLDSRELCPDGNCTGVVENGRCKLCGLAADGSRSEVAVSHPPEDDWRGSEGHADSEWEGRQLCPDGACVGVLHDGKCSVCGRSAAAT